MTRKAHLSIGLLVGLVVGVAEPADANTLRVSGTACSAQGFVGTWNITSAGGSHVMHNLTENWFECPFVSSSDLKHFAVTSLTVNVRDGNANAGQFVTAQACVAPWSANTVLCGTMVDTSMISGGTGDAALQPSLTTWWAHQDWFPYIDLHLPPRASPDYGNYIYSYWASN